MLDAKLRLKVQNINQLNWKNRQQAGGYVALASVLVIAAVIVVIGISTSLLSINELQSSFANRRSEMAIAIVESCVEEALIVLNEKGNVPTSITSPNTNCSVTINSQVGSTWDFTVLTTVEDHTKRIRIVIDRGSNLILGSWLETT